MAWGNFVLLLRKSYLALSFFKLMWVGYYIFNCPVALVLVQITFNNCHIAKHMLYLLSIISLGKPLLGWSATLRHWLLKLITVWDSLCDSALAAPRAELAYLVNRSDLSSLWSLWVSVWVYKGVDVIVVRENFLLELLVRRPIVLNPDTRLGSNLFAGRLAWWCWCRGVLRNLRVSHL